MAMQPENLGKLSEAEIKSLVEAHAKKMGWWWGRRVITKYRAEGARLAHRFALDKGDDPEWVRIAEEKAELLAKLTGQADNDDKNI